MQSVQFQNLDRIVRNSTEKEQKKQSDGESFLDIMKKSSKGFADRPKGNGRER